MRQEDAMFDLLIRRWWIVALRGIVAVGIGVAALIEPTETLGLLVALFGLFALGEAFFTIGAGLSLNWLLLFLEGVFGGAVGLLTLFYRPAAEAWFVELIVAWALVTGALYLVGAVTLRHMDRTLTTGERLLVASGVLTLLFGGTLALWPDMAVPTFAAIVSSYAIASGALLLVLALNIRTWRPLIAAG
jgi:uncharacterized membrane protein HdeD (DUF308 family)